MIYYIVTDKQRKAHLVEANSPGEAIVSVPNGELVRVATSREVNYMKSEAKNG